MRIAITKCILVTGMGLCAAMLFTLGVVKGYEISLLPGAILTITGAIMNEK